MSPAGDGYVLAVDLGTGGPKVGVVATTGRIVGHAAAPVALHLLDGGGAEQDPDEWWSAICDAAGRALAAAGVPPEAVVAVGCTSQWSGTVAVGPGGRPLMRAVIWMDSRGNKAIRRMAGGPVNVLGYDPRKILRWVQVTGGAPGLSGKDPVAHILFIRDAFPDVYRDTVTFLEPVDYLNLRLTGRTCASFDSIAAHWVTDNRAVDRVVYDERLLEVTGLDRAKLPELVPPGTIIGELSKPAASELGLPPGLPVSVGSGDVHSAVFGSGAVDDFEAHLYIGTSSWISAHVPFKKTAPTSNVASIPAALAGKYVIVDEHETAGACLTFLRDNLGLADGFEAMNAMVAAVEPGSGRVLFTPWLNGERSPVDDHTLRGGFHNLSLPPPATRWSGRSTRGWHSTRDGCSRRSRSSPVGPSRRWPSSAVGPTRTSGPRSTPTCSGAISARWPIPSWPMCEVPPSSPWWRSASCGPSRSRAWSRSGERSCPTRPADPSTTSCSRSS